MNKKVAIIGGGPSGLIAAEILSQNNFDVTIYERKPSFARKFLMAGRGGLNITHSEDINRFVQRYNDKSDVLEPSIKKFSPKMLREWCHKLGEETFIGSSGRVFPKSFKASPLLRAWLKRLEGQNVSFKLNHNWTGWDNENLVFEHKDEKFKVHADITVLSLGGASWPKLGADGSWTSILTPKNVKIIPFRPSNCGFKVNWSDIFRNKFAGKPLKSIGLSFEDKSIIGEFIITKEGVEGSAIYAFSSLLRDEIQKSGFADLILDLKPDLRKKDIIKRLNRPKSRMSVSNYLRKTLNLCDISLGLIMERPDRKKLNDLSAEELTSIVKSYSIRLEKPFPINRAISTAGGVSFSSVNNDFMLKNQPNIYITGEMLDWEAPTGGYLLQACFASGVHVANSIIKRNSKVA